MINQIKKKIIIFLSLNYFWFFFISQIIISYSFYSIFSSYHISSINIQEHYTSIDDSNQVIETHYTIYNIIQDEDTTKEIQVKITKIIDNQYIDQNIENNNKSILKSIYNFGYAIVKVYVVLLLLDKLNYFYIWVLPYFIQNPSWDLTIVPPSPLPPIPPLLIEEPLHSGTILYPSVIGSSAYSDDDIWNIRIRLENEFYLYSQQVHIMDDHYILLNQNYVMCDFLHTHPLRDSIFSYNLTDLQNTNYVINKLIADCIIQYGLTENKLYYDIALGLFIEQLALINYLDPLSCYEDITIYTNMQNEFMAHFRI